jgi:GNAT superfamily N-acetyltransferase
MVRTQAESGVVEASGWDVPRLALVLSAAFADNPVSDWIFSGQQAQHHPAFFGAFLTCAMQAGRVEQSSDGTAVAVWIDYTTPLPVPLVGSVRREVAQALGPHLHRWEVFEHAAKATAPAEPHWWLAFLGVMPTHQERGHGGRLLDHAARWLERSPGYLEATSRRLAGFYGRHGWRDVGSIRVPDGPILHRMRHPGAPPTGPSAGPGTTAIGQVVGE